MTNAQSGYTAQHNPSKMSASQAAWLCYPVLLLLTYIHVTTSTHVLSYKTNHQNSTSNDVIGEWHNPKSKSGKDYNKKWNDIEEEEDYDNDYEVDDLTSESDVGQRMLSLVETLSGEVSALRGQISNVKYQNHLIYKQLKRMNNRCINSPAPLLTKNMCPKDFVWNPELKRCYKFAHDRITWRMAREKCRQMDAELISIRDSKTQVYVTDMAHKAKELRHCDFWIGATDSHSEGDWRWTGNNMQLLYANWNTNEPNNGSGDEHCAMMLWVFNWSWNDARCKTDNACYICESTLIE